MPFPHTAVDTLVLQAPICPQWIIGNELVGSHTEAFRRIAICLANESGLNPRLHKTGQWLPRRDGDLTDMSDGDMPAAEPKAAAVRRKVVVKCVVVTASHVLV